MAGFEVTWKFYGFCLSYMNLCAVLIPCSVEYEMVPCIKYTEFHCHATLFFALIF